MDKERDAIPLNAKRLAWYMRGGINYIDILNMSSTELNQINEIIEENLETTKKTKLNFF